MHVSIVEPGTIATPMWTKPQRAVDEFPPEAAERYGARIDKFRKLAAARSSKGVPPVEVAKAVEHALTAEPPRTRYLVGRDAKLRARIQKLPDRLRDRVLTKFLFGS
jgi:NAD(P)-dependent dehydrogenase (short-subunit alcohol dehydrogenase family)